MTLRVLLIDDNQDQVTITQKTLKKHHEDCLLDAAATAHDGLAQLKTGGYDVVLCDYRLPDLSGIEILQQLKASGNHVPFILVTSMGNERLAVEAMKLGAADYVVKDASYDTILPEVIRKAVERFQEKQERARLAAERDEAVEALKKEKMHLEAFNKVMMDRERRILDLKREVNALLAELSRPQKYT